jgi:hypothetical protein
VGAGHHWRTSTNFPGAEYIADGIDLNYQSKIIHPIND